MKEDAVCDEIANCIRYKISGYIIDVEVLNKFGSDMYRYQY